MGTDKIRKWKWCTMDMNVAMALIMGPTSLALKPIPCTSWIGPYQPAIKLTSHFVVCNPCPLANNLSFFHCHLEVTWGIDFLWVVEIYILLHMQQHQNTYFIGHGWICIIHCNGWKYDPLCDISSHGMDWWDMYQHSRNKLENYANYAILSTIISQLFASYC